MNADVIASSGHGSGAFIGAADPAGIERCWACDVLNHCIESRRGSGLRQEGGEASTRSEKLADVLTPLVEAPLGEGPCRAELGGVRPGSRGICLVHRPTSEVARYTGDTV